MDLTPIKQAVIDGDDKQAADLTRGALDEGASAETVLDGALIVGMGEVGELF
jgi:methanogenic corrinoid protein MtbC1